MESHVIAMMREVLSRKSAAERAEILADLHNPEAADSVDSDQGVRLDENDSVTLTTGDQSPRLDQRPSSPSECSDDSSGVHTPISSDSEEASAKQLAGEVAGGKAVETSQADSSSGKSQVDSSAHDTPISSHSEKLVPQRTDPVRPESGAKLQILQSVPKLSPYKQTSELKDLRPQRIIDKYNDSFYQLLRLNKCLVDSVARQNDPDSKAVVSRVENKGLFYDFVSRVDQPRYDIDTVADIRFLVNKVVKKPSLPKWLTRSFLHDLKTKGVDSKKEVTAWYKWIGCVPGSELDVANGKHDHFNKTLERFYGMLKEFRDTFPG